jgi:hypothetical protein
MKKIYRVVSISLFVVLGFSLMITVAGCQLEKSSNDSTKALLPLLLTGGSPPNTVCPNYSDTIVTNQTVKVNYGIHRIIINQKGLLRYSNFSSFQINLTLYDSSCSVVPVVGGVNWNVTPGTYYVKTSSQNSNSNYSIALDLPRESGCSIFEYAYRYKNSTSKTCSFLNYNSAGCTGMPWGSYGSLSPGSTGSYVCVPGTSPTFSPSANNGSYDICSGSTSTQVEGHDYTVELKSDETWERITDY